jgi:type II secretory ATPase GspE/PulE/Tfp pilus assembly ATPase PilB-like protein
MATRLIRRLCSACKKEYKLTERDIKNLEVTQAEVEGKKIYAKGNGCEVCHGQGYTGRAPIHELLIMTDGIREVLMKTLDASIIRKASIDAGMRSLRQSAVDKVLAGVTSIEEAISKTQTEELEVDYDEKDRVSATSEVEDNAVLPPPPTKAMKGGLHEE